MIKKLLILACLLTCTSVPAIRDLHAAESRCVPNPRIAVLDVRGLLGTVVGPANAFGFGGAMAAQFRSAILESSGNGLSVVDREHLLELVKEFEARTAGVTKNITGAFQEAGELDGVDWFAGAHITEYEPRAVVKGRKFTLKIPWLVSFEWNLEREKVTARIALEVKLINARTSGIPISFRVESEVEFLSEGDSVELLANTTGGAGAGGGYAQVVSERSPIGKATRRALLEASVRIRDYILERPVTSPSAMVASVFEGEAYVNIGKLHAANVGDRLRTFSIVNRVRDPFTGLEFGTNQRPSGEIQLTHVDECFSVGKVLSGTPNGRDLARQVPVQLVANEKPALSEPTPAPEKSAVKTAPPSANIPSTPAPRIARQQPSTQGPKGALKAGQQSERVRNVQAIRITGAQRSPRRPQVTQVRSLEKGKACGVVQLNYPPKRCSPPPLATTGRKSRT